MFQRKNHNERYQDRRFQRFIQKKREQFKDLTQTYEEENAKHLRQIFVESLILAKDIFCQIVPVMCLNTIAQLACVNKTPASHMRSEYVWEKAYRTLMPHLAHSDMRLTWYESFKVNHTLIRKTAIRFASVSCMTHSKLLITGKLIRSIHVSIRTFLMNMDTVSTSYFSWFFSEVHNISRVECWNSLRKTLPPYSDGCMFALQTMLKELLSAFGFDVSQIPLGDKTIYLSNSNYRYIHSSYPCVTY